VSHENIVRLYERHAQEFDRDRGRTLQEKAWLDRFMAHLRPAATVLDIGCGMGEPIARHLIEAGHHVVGIDSSPSMIAMCRARFPDGEWMVADMRGLALGRRFDGVLAWHSFFHLTKDDQRAMVARFASHARPGAPLMFTSGSVDGETIGSCCGEPLYHASLARAEYEQVLAVHAFVVRAHVADDESCGNATVWLATYEPSG
jgi:2-polyprenyl-3-methyl-5-hydroxy-6-metoxy-1,4-benzoquinol methylase